MRLHEALKCAPYSHKTAADEDEGTSAPVLGGMAAAAALPFAGLLGTGNRANHREKGVSYEDWEAFKKTLREGDVLLTGDSGLNSTKAQVSMVDGTPEGYHTAIVGPRGQIYEAHPNGGFRVRALDALAPDEARFTNVQSLRPDLSPEQRALFVRKMTERHKYTESLKKTFEQQLLKRRSGNDEFARELQRLSPKQLVAKARELTNTYSKYQAAGTGFTELFVPKLRSQSSLDAAAKAMAQARAKDTVPSVASKLVEGFQKLTRSKDWATKELSGDELLSCIPGSQRGICSTVPAQALHEVSGKHVVPGKRTTDVIPSDWLHSDAVKPVSRFTRQSPNRIDRLGDRLLRSGPAVTRTLAGLGLAGSVYGASKLLGRSSAGSEGDE